MNSQFVVAGAIFLTACASQPNKIPSQSVSTLVYKDYSCDQLAMEADRVDRRAGELYASLKNTADNDAMQMGVGLVLFLADAVFPRRRRRAGGPGVRPPEGRARGHRNRRHPTEMRHRIQAPETPG